jgi:hypothetical protein
MELVCALYGRGNEYEWDCAYEEQAWVYTAVDNEMCSSSSNARTLLENHSITMSLPMSPRLHHSCQAKKSALL